MPVEMKLSNKDYHARAELSASQIKLLLENPYKFIHNIPVNQTQEMLLGSVIHKLILEPESFDEEYAVLPECNLRTKEGRKLKADFEYDNSDKQVISHEMHHIAQQCTDAVLTSKARLLLKDGIAEASYFGELDGVKCRCRPDYYVPDRQMIIDIKKCSDASKSGFTRAMVNFQYFIQASFYSDLMASIGKPINEFIFVCIEPKSPFMIGLYTLTPMAMDYGRAQYKEALLVLKNLTKYNQPLYKAPENDCFIQEIDLPGYLYAQKGLVKEVAYG